MKIKKRGSSFFPRRELSELRVRVLLLSGSVETLSQSTVYLSESLNESYRTVTVPPLITATKTAIYATK